MSNDYTQTPAPLNNLVALTEAPQQAQAALDKVMNCRFSNFDAGAVIHWAERGLYQVKVDPVSPPQAHVPAKTESRWQWWAGADEEWCTVGPEDSREAIIQAATNDCLGEFQDEEGRWKLGFHIVEARQDPLRLGDWIEADELLNRAEDGVADSDRVTSEYDDGPYFECTPAQTNDFRERIERACDEWQAAHDLVFTCRTFSHTRNNAHVVVDHPSPAATTEGSDRG